MTDLLLQFAISNLLVALPIALVAWAVQRTGKRPAIAHLLWLVVLAKLVTPPIFTAAVLPIHEPAAVGTAVVAPAAAVATVERGAIVGIAAEAPSNWSLADTKSGLALAWLLGSAIVLGWSLVRIVRFDRLLRVTSEPAPSELQQVADDLSHRLGLATTPTILTTSARLSPMAWWIGGSVRVVVPAALLQETDGRQVRWIVAHELAHVRRRDHMVRWLEWAACVALWWNPVAWWARRSLRVNEEICCDALVLDTLRPDPRRYANSLLTVVEFLSTPTFRPPVLASAMTGRGSLERRFTMIISSKPRSPKPRWWRAAALLCALVILPLGVSQAEEDPDWDAIRQRIEEAVERGDLTREQADAKYERMRAGKRSDRAEKPDWEAIKKRIEGAVERGEMTREEADAKYAAIKREMAGRRAKKDVDWEGIRRRVEGAVERGEMTREEADAKYEAIKKRMGAQSKGIEGIYKRMGIDADGLDRIRKHLAENRFTEEQTEQALGGMLRIAHERKAEGEAFELDPKLAAYFTKEAGLSPEQIETLVGLARRLTVRADAKPSREEMEAVKKKIWEGVEKGEVTEEQARERWEGYLKSVKGARSDGGKRERKALTWEDYRRAELEMNRAVEAGKLTREAADARLAKMREMIVEKEQRGEDE